jgi:hypothetical protein
LYYCEEYYDYYAETTHYAYYAMGDYHYKPNPDSLDGIRKIGNTINTLMQGDPNEIKQMTGYRSYYGVYYHTLQGYAARHFKVKWTYEDEYGVVVTKTKESFSAITDGRSPGGGFDQYLFYEFTDVSEAYAKKSSPIVTIFYKTHPEEDVFGDYHADNNYDHFYNDKNGDGILTEDEYIGGSLVIKTDEVEDARNP